MNNSGCRFVWYELTAADVEGAKAFYAAVLGWRTANVSMPGSPYALFIAKDTPVAGLLGLPPDALKAGAEPQWIGYVAVASVDDASNRVEKLGGTVHVPPADVLGVSRFSIVADPQRATIALVNDREGSQQQQAPRGPGAVGWHELHTASIERSFDFYGPLLGWQKAGAPADPKDPYQEFSAGGETIGGMLARPGQSDFSLWLYHFNVAGVAAAANRVEAAGGQILDGPFTVKGGAQAIHCRDPQGAIFALIDKRARMSVGCYSPSGSSDLPGGGLPQ
jgi:predicted enzyme related to lactoylglutathione lyase